MIRISYSAPDEAQLSGDRTGFAALLAELRSMISTEGDDVRVAADTRFNPAPYDQRLVAIEFRRALGATCVSVSGKVLRVSGSKENLALFGSWLDFERETAPTHRHYDYLDGEPWVARDSVPLVISLECDEE